MKKIKNNNESINQMIKEKISKIEQIKEQKVVSLFVKIIVAATLKECYEKSNKISTIQSDWTE